MPDTTITPTAGTMGATGISPWQAWLVTPPAVGVAITGTPVVPGWHRVPTAAATTITGTTAVISGKFSGYGGGTTTGVVMNMADSTALTLFDWHNIPDGHAWRIICRVVASEAFRLNVLTTPDSGTTTVVGKQVSSSAVNVDGATAGYDNVAELDVPLGYMTKIQIYNGSGSTLNAVWEWRRYLAE